jgi:hypothetical protein
MNNAMQHPHPGRSRKAGLPNVVAIAIVGLSLATPQLAQAQTALGVPFTGRNHLSLSVTELSHDGTSAERDAVFGGVYGRRLGSDAALLQYSVIARTAFRANSGIDDGIVDAGLTVAATHSVRAIDGLSITGAAGVGAMVWAQGSNAGELERGRVIASAPFSAGLSYDVRLGRATISPFIAVTGAYSKERDYLDGDRIGEDSGWRVGNSVGVSLRFWEAVLSVREISRERGLPSRNRVAFSAGISW